MALEIQPAEHFASAHLAAAWGAYLVDMSRGVAPSGEWRFLAEFDDEDRSEFVEEVREALDEALFGHNSSRLASAIHAWRETARAISDPDRRQVLLADSSDDSDFVAVGRPE